MVHRHPFARHWVYVRSIPVLRAGVQGLNAIFWSFDAMTRSYSASVKGIKSLLYSIMRCPDLSLFRVFRDVAHLMRLRFARS